jgi:hypothetical protein
MVKHTVQDYGKWKPIYDADGKNRKAAGCKGSQLFQDESNPNEITAILEFGSKEQALKMLESEDLRKTMQDAGVVGKPEFSFLNGGQRYAF